MKLFQKSLLLLRFLFLLSGCFNIAAAQSHLSALYFNTDTVATFQLPAVNGKPFAYKTTTLLSCFFFLSPDCPLSKNYAPVINELREKYKIPVGFYLIVPGQSYTIPEIKAFSNEYLKKAVLYKDAGFGLSHYLRATVTPQVIVIETKTGKQVYAGALDNWAVSLGRQRIKATENYLRDAIESYLQHKVPAITFKEPVGCFINDF